MQPHLQVMAWRQYNHTPAALHSPPGAGLFAMLRSCGYKDIGFRIIQRHKIMLIPQCKWIAPYGERITRARSDRHRALFGMMREYSSQQAAQHLFLLVPGCSGVDRKQSV